MSSFWRFLSSHVAEQAKLHALWALSPRAGYMLRKGGSSTSLVSNGRRKVHTTFSDESELVEEYDVNTDELLGARRPRTACAGVGALRFDCGAAARPQFASAAARPFWGGSRTGRCE